MPVPRSAAGVRMTLAPIARMILRRSTEKESAIARLEQTALLRVIDNCEREPVLDRRQGIK